MTEFDLVEVLYMHYDTMFKSAAMYYSLVTAYLVAGYIAAGKLTTPQYVIVNSLYLVWVSGTIFNVFTEFHAAQKIAAELVRLDSIAVSINLTQQVSIGTYSFLFVQIAGLLASLYFVWSIRHPAESKAQSV